MRFLYSSGSVSRMTFLARSMPTALPPMQPVPMTRFFMAIRSSMVKYFRHSSRRLGSLPSRQRSMFSLRARPSSSTGSALPFFTESNMLSQQSRRSPVWVKMSKMA